MKTVKIVLSLAFFLVVKVILSQTPVGQLFDINGEPFNGYFDPFTYHPDNKIKKVHNSDSYEIGHYYDRDGNKISGQIQFSPTSILFKNADTVSGEKLKSDEIECFVIGVDSFFVTSNFYFKNRLKTNPEFVQYIAEINGNIFAKYYYTSGLRQRSKGPLFIETFLAKPQDSKTWDDFQKKHRFKENALKYFAHIPYLKKKITAGEYNSKDMMSLIRMAEYFEKYKHSELIYFDAYWQGVNNKKQSKFYAKISDKKDSIWTFDYFNDSIHLHTANYVSFYPNKKCGEFTAYYPSGTPRQITRYEDDKAKEVKTFDKSGRLKKHYQYIEKRIKGVDEAVDIEYITVNDSQGNILPQFPNTIDLVETDELTGVEYTSTFSEKELLSSYRIIDQDTVFRIVDPDYNFKLKPLQRAFDIVMGFEEYDEALSVNAQGTILISCVLNKKGRVVDYSILNGIHPQIDSIVEKVASRMLSPIHNFSFKLKPYKTGKTKQFCEVVIPFEFSTNRFYREPANYHNFDHMFMQMEMHQQMLNNIPTAPSF
jgi:hypothetical protein